MTKEVNPSVIKVSEYVKRLLKQKGLKQQDLADHLCVSLPTVKKMLNHSDLSFDRICDIAIFFQMSVADFIQHSQSNHHQRDVLTTEQENYLAKNIEHWVVFILTIGHHSPIEIQDEIGIVEEKLKTILYKLDSLKLIEFSEEKVVRFKLSWPFDCAQDGPVAKAYFRPFVQYTFGKVGHELGYLEKLNSYKSALFRLEASCSQKTAETFFEDINSAIDNFFENSRKDKFSVQNETLRYFSFAGALGEFSAWKDLYFRSKKE